MIQITAVDENDDPIADIPQVLTSILLISAARQSLDNVAGEGERFNCINEMLVNAYGFDNIEADFSNLREITLNPPCVRDGFINVRTEYNRIIENLRNEGEWNGLLFSDNDFFNVGGGLSEPFNFVGETNSHPINHYIKEESLRWWIKLIHRLRENGGLPDAPVNEGDFSGVDWLQIGLNDCSLPFGGIFDLGNDFVPSHFTHRSGRSSDFRTNRIESNQPEYANGELELNELRDAMQDIGLGSNPPQPDDTAYVILEAAGLPNEHYHIQFMIDTRF